MGSPEYAWLDGLVKWEEATCHISSLAFKYGAAVFEGVRAYWNEDQQTLYVWQLNEHLKRLEYSQRFMRYDQVFSSSRTCISRSPPSCADRGNPT